MLNVYWRSHDPTQRTWSAQYKSAIFFNSPDQEQVARRSKARHESDRNARFRTEILPATPFYRAEDYHQKYGLRQDATLARALIAIYPDPDRFTDSTVAARLNGYLYGYGSLEQFERELDSYGLPRDARRRLQELLRDREGR